MSPSPYIIAIGGLPGSGKTTLADKLAGAMTAAGQKTVCIDSDRVRKAIYGVAENVTLPPEAYKSDVTRRVIEKIHCMTQEHLKSGHTVIQSATFVTEDTRQRQRAAALALGVSFKGIFLTCDAGVLKNRIQARQARRDSASDAGTDILNQLLNKYQPPADWQQVNADQPIEGVLQHTLAVLKKPGLNAKPKTCQFK